MSRTGRRTKFDPSVSLKDSQVKDTPQKLAEMAGRLVGRNKGRDSGDGSNLQNYFGRIELFDYLRMKKDQGKTSTVESVRKGRADNAPGKKVIGHPK